MHWLSAGFVLYSFAAPSSITGVAYTFAHAGLLLGAAFCIVSTAASVGGALLLLEVVLACPSRLRMLSDVGTAAMGPTGGAWSLGLQMLNFLLYLPVALLTTAQALQDAIEPSGTTCTSYFVFLVAAVCFGLTQSRDFTHASLLAGLALAAALGVAMLQLAVAFSTPLPASDDRPQPAPLAGSPSGSSLAQGLIEAALALTTCVWSYVPSLLVAELAHEMAEPQLLRRSICFSGGLNLLVFLCVGLAVAARWGEAVSDPITISPLWPAAAPTARALSALLCCANLVSYALDSVPLARWCQRRFAPDFRDGWGAADVGQYALLALPSWVFAVLAATFVGAPSGLFVMLAWVTALTVPSLNLILPALIALAADGSSKHAERTTPLLPEGRQLTEEGEEQWSAPLRLRLSHAQRYGAHAVLLTGVVSLAVCTAAAVGKSVDPQVRGPEVIGCKGWGIYKSNGTHFRGF